MSATEHSTTIMRRRNIAAHLRRSDWLLGTLGATSRYQCDAVSYASPVDHRNPLMRLSVMQRLCCGQLSRRSVRAQVFVAAAHAAIVLPMPSTRRTAALRSLRSSRMSVPAGRFSLLFGRALSLAPQPALCSPHIFTLRESFSRWAPLPLPRVAYYSLAVYLFLVHPCLQLRIAASILSFSRSIREQSCRSLIQLMLMSTRSLAATRRECQRSYY